MPKKRPRPKGEELERQADEARKKLAEAEHRAEETLKRATEKLQESSRLRSRSRMRSDLGRQRRSRWAKSYRRSPPAAQISVSRILPPAEHN